MSGPGGSPVLVSAPSVVVLVPSSSSASSSSPSSSGVIVVTTSVELPSLLASVVSSGASPHARLEHRAIDARRVARLMRRAAYHSRALAAGREPVLEHAREHQVDGVLVAAEAV